MKDIPSLNLQNRGNSTSPRVQNITSVTVTVHYRKIGSYFTAINTNGRHSMSWLTRIRIGHWYVDVALAYCQTYILLNSNDTLLNLTVEGLNPSFTSIQYD